MPITESGRDALTAQAESWGLHRRKRMRSSHGHCRAAISFAGCCVNLFAAFLHVERWICRECGPEHERDANAAINLRRVWLRPN
jgi:hypothetical protein